MCKERFLEYSKLKELDFFYDSCGKNILSNIDRFLDLVFKHLPPRKYKGLELRIIRKKLYRLLLGLKVNTKNNIDTVTYEPETNPNFIATLFDTVETFIKLDIHKLTGLSYNEFKNLTVLEQIVILEYVKQKKDEEAIVSDIVAEEADKLESKLENGDLVKTSIDSLYRNEGF